MSHNTTTTTAHNSHIAATSTTASVVSGGNQNSLLNVTNNQRSHYDFKNRRSSSEPVHDQALLQSSMQLASIDQTSPNKQSGKDEAIDDEVLAKNDGYIDCLQKITNIKVSQPILLFQSFTITHSLSLTLSSLFNSF